MKILVEQHYRDAWLAFDDDTYDGPGSALGHGQTREEAIVELVNKLDEEGLFRSKLFFSYTVRWYRNPFYNNRVVVLDWN